MIEKLVEEAQKEASHKAFCDKEMSETKAKRDDKQTELDDLNTKIDKATPKIAKLKEEIATLQKELAAIAELQAKATAMRAEEAEAWAGAKKDFEDGVEGVGMALKVLRDYYAEKEALIQTTQDNEIATTEKSTAVKYATKDQKETEEALISLKEALRILEEESGSAAFLQVRSIRRAA